MQIEVNAGNRFIYLYRCQSVITVCTDDTVGVQSHSKKKAAHMHRVRLQCMGGRNGIMVYSRNKLQINVRSKKNIGCKRRREPSLISRHMCYVSQRKYSSGFKQRTFSFHIHIQHKQQATIIWHTSTPFDVRTSFYALNHSHTHWYGDEQATLTGANEWCFFSFLSCLLYVFFVWLINLAPLTDDVRILCGCNEPGIFAESAQFVFWP